MKINKYFILSIINIFLIIKPSDISFYILSAIENTHTGKLKLIDSKRPEDNDIYFDQDSIFAILRTMIITNNYSMYNTKIENFNSNKHRIYTGGSGFLGEFMKRTYDLKEANNKHDPKIKHIFTTGTYEKKKEINQQLQNIVKNYELKSKKNYYNADINKKIFSIEDLEKIVENNSLLESQQETQINIIDNLTMICGLNLKIINMLSYCLQNNIQKIIFCLPFANKAISEIIFDEYNKAAYIKGKPHYLKDTKEASELIDAILLNTKDIDGIELLSNNDTYKTESIEIKILDSIWKKLETECNEMIANKIMPAKNIDDIKELIGTLFFIFDSKKNHDNENLLQKKLSILKKFIEKFRTLLNKNKNNNYTEFRTINQKTKIIKKLNNISLEHLYKKNNQTNNELKLVHEDSLEYPKDSKEFNSFIIQYHKLVHNHTTRDDDLIYKLTIHLINQYNSFLRTNEKTDKTETLLCIDFLTFIFQRPSLIYNLKNNLIIFLLDTINSTQRKIITKEEYQNIISEYNNYLTKNEGYYEEDLNAMEKQLINLKYKFYLQRLNNKSNQIKHDILKKNISTIILLFSKDIDDLSTIKTIYEIHELFCHFDKLNKEIIDKNIDNGTVEELLHKKIIDSPYIRDLEVFFTNNFENKKLQKLKELYDKSDNLYASNIISLFEFFDIIETCKKLIKENNIEENQQLLDTHNEYLENCILWSNLNINWIEDNE